MKQACDTTGRFRRAGGLSSAAVRTREDGGCQNGSEKGGDLHAIEPTT